MLLNHLHSYCLVFEKSIFKLITSALPALFFNNYHENFHFKSVFFSQEKLASTQTHVQ